MAQQHQVHAGGLRGAGVGLGIAHHQRVRGSHAVQRRQVQQRHRVRLAFGQGVAADDVREVVVDAHRPRQHARHALGLVGRHRHRHAGVRQCIERFDGAGIEACVEQQAVLVVDHQPRHHRVHVGGAAGMAQGAFEQHARAQADPRAHGGLVLAGVAKFLEGAVHRLGDVGGAVDQGAVEVEQHQGIRKGHAAPPRLRGRPLSPRARARGYPRVPRAADRSRRVVVPCPGRDAMSSVQPRCPHRREIRSRPMPPRSRPPPPRAMRA